MTTVWLMLAVASAAGTVFLAVWTVGDWWRRQAVTAERLRTAFAILNANRCRDLSCTCNLDRV